VKGKHAYHGVADLVESSVGAAIFGEPRDVELKGLNGTHTVFAIAST
jgi:hypothetical protein